MPPSPGNDARPLWHEAAALAARAHRGQLRKDGSTPYTAHPARVAMVVSTIFGCDDEAVIAAAYLHDTIEDCGTDYDDILEGFGPAVADLVAVMTKDMRLIEPKRERAYDEQLAAGPWQGRLIKLADVYDNLCDAETDADKRTLLGKADRALHLAEHDEPLAGPRERLEALVAQVRGGLAAG